MTGPCGSLIGSSLLLLFSVAIFSHRLRRTDAGLSALLPVVVSGRTVTHRADFQHLIWLINITVLCNDAREFAAPGSLAALAGLR